VLLRKKVNGIVSTTHLAQLHIHLGKRLSPNSYLSLQIRPKLTPCSLINMAGGCCSEKASSSDSASARQNKPQISATVGSGSDEPDCKRPSTPNVESEVPSKNPNCSGKPCCNSGGIVTPGGHLKKEIESSSSWLDGGAREKHGDHILGVVPKTGSCTDKPCCQFPLASTPSKSCTVQIMKGPSISNKQTVQDYHKDEAISKDCPEESSCSKKAYHAAVVIENDCGQSESQNEISSRNSYDGRISARNKILSGVLLKDTGCSDGPCCQTSSTLNVDEHAPGQKQNKVAIASFAVQHHAKENIALNLSNPIESTVTILTSPSALLVPGNGIECSDKTCCKRKLEAPLKHEPVKPKAMSLETDVSYTTIDIESTIAVLNTERIIMDVQGMTCVGCEKNLRKALISIKALSNINTSLLLAQAEFDMETSHGFTFADVVKEITRMTGFSCTRSAGSGDELELILDSKELKIPYISLPAGTTTRFQEPDRLFVSYNPKAIGARTLLSDPFFQHSKLAPLRAPASVIHGKDHLRRSVYMTLLSIVLTIPVLVLAYGQLPEHHISYGAVSLCLATIIQVVVARKYYIKAYKTLVFSRMIEMDMLVVLSTTTAYIYSIIAFAFLVHGKPLTPGSFFETSTLLVTLIMVGQTIAEYARQQAVESISIESLQTPTAVIVDQKMVVEQEIDARLLQYGDVFKVLPDEIIVTDGIVVEGKTEVDESMITGEVTMIEKDIGSTLIAGSINHSGTIFVQLTRLPSENTIKSIGSMVEEAKLSKPKVQDMADRVAGYFTPIILALTVLVFIIWLAVGISVRGNKKSTACINAMTFAISTLIVSCPCAIGLAVPMVVVIACGVAAQHGLILKRADSLEIGHKISHVVFDKTGTLTQGYPSVIEEHYLVAPLFLKPAILGLLINSKHPVAAAVTAHLQAKNLEATHVDQITSVTGCGIEGTWNGVQIRAGNQYWLGLENLPDIQRISSKGLTMICVVIDAKLVAIFAVQDYLRPETISTIHSLNKRGIATSIISGDHPEAVNAVAMQLSIPPENVRARCSPSNKAVYIKSLLATPKSIVLFVGDGTNDAVALAQASIGIHMNSGTDIAQSAADIILMNSSLHGILSIIDLSYAFRRRVLFNFIWSAIYNLGAILLAAGAFESLNSRVRIQPRYAGLGELVSVLPVVAVAVSLRWTRF